MEFGPVLGSESRTTALIVGMKESPKRLLRGGWLGLQELTLQGSLPGGAWEQWL